MIKEISPKFNLVLFTNEQPNETTQIWNSHFTFYFGTCLEYLSKVKHRVDSKFDRYQVLDITFFYRTFFGFVYSLKLTPYLISFCSLLYKIAFKLKET